MSEYIQEGGVVESHALGRKDALEGRGACYRLLVHHAKRKLEHVRQDLQDIDVVVAGNADRQQL